MEGYMYIKVGPKEHGKVVPGKTNINKLEQRRTRNKAAKKSRKKNR